MNLSVHCRSLPALAVWAAALAGTAVSAQTAPKNYRIAPTHIFVPKPVPNPAGKQVEWKTYEDPDHGFVFVRRNEKGVSDPDPVQRQALTDALAYFARCLAK